ncbi:unnamed protein product [Schistocephalus solidus]|uniref:Enolase n=1 Tax=Schistocephalus solidus TaxID=70667 RepID=A0A183SSN9_SCHSO|nr:unnamed protein product [Schistocephalus solidus]
MAITSIHARQIFDSHGNPTVEVDLTTAKGLFRAAVPSGASTGIFEAVELRDDNPSAYMGKGVSRAVSNVNRIIAPALMNQSLTVTQQTEIDEIMTKTLDGTENKCKLGANAIVGVSIAACKAGAAENGVSLYRHIANLAGNKKVCLPVPAFNVINGGRHAGNMLAMQEFMILPVGAISFTEAMKMATEVYHHLRNVIRNHYGLDACNVGDEGGFAPNIRTQFEGLDLIQEAIEIAGYTGLIKIGVDAAASEFYKAGRYDLDFKNAESKESSWLTAEQLSNIYTEMTSRYPIVLLEDPFDQEDWNAFQEYTAKSTVKIVGDDLLVTNPALVQKAIDTKACTALLLKVNQIGSVTEAIEACKVAQNAGWPVMVSHRSGETADTFIADFAVGLNAGLIKTGAPCRSERLVKYNQLLRIEEELGDSAIYAGPLFQNKWSV